MAFRLPQDKLSRLVNLVDGFCSVKKVTLAQLQSLLGRMVFASRIMPMGRVFSRRLSLATRGASVFWVSTMAGLAVLPQSKIIRTFTCSRMLPVRWVLVQFLEIAGALCAGP